MGKCKYGKIGEKYGRLTIIGEAESYIYPSGNKERRVLVQCDCNSEPFEVALNSLRSGKTTSCGCVCREKAKETHKKYNKYDLTGDYGIGYTSKGREFYFDKDDFDLIKDYCWCIGSKDGYVIARGLNTKKTILMHRLVTNCPKDKVVDHINHDTTNNRKSNLRICSHSENGKNRSVSKNNKIGVTGVSWEKARNKWRATIKINGKRIHLGLFENLEEAIKARLEAEKKYFGEFSNNKTMNT